MMPNTVYGYSINRRGMKTFKTWELSVNEFPFRMKKKEVNKRDRINSGEQGAGRDVRSSVITEIMIDDADNREKHSRAGDDY